MTRVLAKEVGDDSISVNALAPGMTVSEAIADNEHHLNSATVGKRASSATRSRKTWPGAMSFLLSSESDFRTGQCVVVDGARRSTDLQPEAAPSAEELGERRLE